MMIDSAGWTLFENAVNVFQNLLIVDCLTRCFTRKYQDKRHYLFFALFFVLLFAAITIINFLMAWDQYFIFLVPVITVCYCRVNLKGKWVEEIIVSMAIILGIMSISTIVAMICSKVFPMPVTSLMLHSNYSRVVYVIISNLILFSFTRIIIQIKRKQAMQLPILELIPAVVIPALSVILLVFVLDAVQYMPETEMLFSFIAAATVIVINIFVYFLVARLNQQHVARTQLLLKQKNQALYQQEVQSAKKFFDQASKTKHDLANFSLGLKTLLAQQKLKEAAELVDQLAVRVGSVQTFVHSPYPFIDAIINNKMSQAHNSGIETHCQCQFELGQIEEMDLGRILGNLLDNALEALAGCSVKRPSLHLLLENRKDYLIIEVQNTVEQSVLEDNPALKTTKTAPGHGLGLSSVQDLADRYEGAVQFSEDGSNFVAMVMLSYVNG